MILNFQEWFSLSEMVRAASPEESADWLKMFLQQASKSSSDWKRINAPYWLQSDNFSHLLSQILLNKINVFNTDTKKVRNNIQKLMVLDLQKDVGFGSRRNMDYAKSLKKEPEVALHPAYGTHIQYKRPVGGWEEDRGKHRLGTHHSPETKAKIAASTKVAWDEKRGIARRPEKTLELPPEIQNRYMPSPKFKQKRSTRDERIAASMRAIYNKALIDKINAPTLRQQIHSN